MRYIFFDESGDLGFDFSRKKTTKNFILTFLFTEKKRSIEKVVRKIHKGLRKKYKLRDGIIHACREEAVTNRRLCEEMSKQSAKIMVVRLNKEKVYTKLQDQKAVLYNYVTNILLDRIYSKKILATDKPIFFIASKRETNKFLNLNFKNYLLGQMSNNKLDINIEIKTPHEEKGLQAVDVLSWAIFRKYEYGDSEYYDLIKSLIVEENPLFP